MKNKTKIKMNERLWELYQEDMKNKNSPYTIGTFGVWCYHKGLVDGLKNDCMPSEPQTNNTLELNNVTMDTGGKEQSPCFSDKSTPETYNHDKAKEVDNEKE